MNKQTCRSTEVSILKLKIYYKATVNKTVWCCERTDIWINGIEKGAQK